MSFNDFIKDAFIPEGDSQVASGSASLPDTVALETEEQRMPFYWHSKRLRKGAAKMTKRMWRSFDTGDGNTKRLPSQSQSTEN